MNRIAALNRERDMPIWKDKTKNWNDDTIASSETKAGSFRLSIHRHIAYEPDVWLTSCAHIFSQSPLKSKGLQEAKFEAESKLLAILEEAVSDLRRGDY